MDNNNKPFQNKSGLNGEDLGGYENKKGTRSWMTADPLEYEILKENAKNNRKNMTEAESAFWQMASDDEIISWYDFVLVC